LGEFDELIQHLAFHTIDLQSYIYGTLEIEPWKFTDAKMPSVDSDVLELIDDPIIKKIAEYKELYKDKGTYVDNYINRMGIDNRIHPEFKQTSTSTGRPSVANPNLANVDKKGNMRKLFVAKEGCKMVRVDYDQLEWRVLAAITQDPTMLKALLSGKKIHQVTADEMNVEYDLAKKGNFGVNYGAGAWKLAQTMGIPIGQAKEFVAAYFERFPGVKKYQDQMRETATKDKVVKNWFGRTRRIDAMYAPDWRIKEEGVKEAINTPIQGTAGEIAKLAMIQLHKSSAPILNWVYDEFLFEVPEKEAVEYAHYLMEFIPTVVEINGMKFPVEASVAGNWFDCCQKEFVINKEK
jgi:DNA polymerase-1